MKETNEPSLVYDIVLLRAYERYKRQWSKERNLDYSLACEAWLNNRLYCGQMFKSLSEFENSEFRNEQYVQSLFNEKEYADIVAAI